MSEQQYRVIADRDKGDDPKISDAEDGDLLAFRKGREFETDYLVRIERPVPTEHCLSTAQHDGHEWGGHDEQSGTGYWCPGFDAAEEHPLPTTGLPEPMRLTDAEADSFHEAMHAPHPPTREHIAEAIEQDERVQTWHTIWAYVCENHPQPIEDERTAEQYVLALIQNGAER